MGTNPLEINMNWSLLQCSSTLNTLQIDGSGLIMIRSLKSLNDDLNEQTRRRDDCCSLMWKRHRSASSSDVQLNVTSLTPSNLFIFTSVQLQACLVCMKPEEQIMLFHLCYTFGRQQERCRSCLLEEFSHNITGWWGKAPRTWLQKGERPQTVCKISFPRWTERQQIVNFINFSTRLSSTVLSSQEEPSFFFFN